MGLDIPGAFSDLARLVDRMEELLEWQRLSRQEQRRPFATSFDIDNHLEGEMTGLQACFAYADRNLRELLARDDLSLAVKQRQAWQKELERLEARASSLGTPAGL